MSDNKVTLDQLDNSAVEAMSSSVGDVSMLNTENKTIVGALAEIVGKKEIANAIGEPLAETDKFTEMSSEINGLLSTFKTNMMNAGVVVESGDKFKALIDKIQGLTEGEGNKGVQYAEGIGQFNGLNISNNSSFVFEHNLDFTPTWLILYGKIYTNTTSSVEDTYFEYYTTISNNNENNYIFSVGEDRNHEEYVLNIKITNINNASFNIDVTSQVVNIDIITNFMFTDYIAIGVGEEDTTLRDSLASILEEEGVDVTEEDDMASLIIKVDEEFTDKENEISGLETELSNRSVIKTGTLDYSTGKLGEYNDEYLTITHNLGSIPSYIICRTGNTGYLPGGSSVGRGKSGPLCITSTTSSYMVADGNKVTLTITDITETTFKVVTTMSTSGIFSACIEEWWVMA